MGQRSTARGSLDSRGQRAATTGMSEIRSHRDTGTSSGSHAPQTTAIRRSLASHRGTLRPYEPHRLTLVTQGQIRDTDIRACAMQPRGSRPPMTHHDPDDPRDPNRERPPDAQQTERDALPMPLDVETLAFIDMVITYAIERSMLRRPLTIVESRAMERSPLNDND